jgi:hypothetical protein
MTNKKDKLKAKDLLFAAAAAMIIENICAKEE